MAPTSTDLLCTYLNNHLGGAGTGVELAHQLVEDLAGTPDAQLLGPLATEIEQDRDVLRELLEKLGSGRNPIKEAAGWVAEKAHRLAVSETIIGDPDLSTMLTAETLSIGVEGKIELWLALRELTPSYPPLGELDLDGLVVRARDQRSRLEEIRLGAARRAFGPG